MTDHIKVEESYVDALVKNAAWDAARVTLTEKRGDKAGDEGAGRDKKDKGDYTTDAREGDKGKGKKKGDKPDFTTDARKGDKSKTKKGEKDYEDKDDDEDDDDDNGKNESVTARELAEQLLDTLSEEVILEFIDILYASVLNEEAEQDEGDDEEASE